MHHICHTVAVSSDEVNKYESFKHLFNYCVHVCI